MRKVIQQLEEENKKLKEQVKDLDLTILILKSRIRELEKQGKHYYEKIKELSDFSSKYYKENEKLKKVIKEIKDIFYIDFDDNRNAIYISDDCDFIRYEKGYFSDENYELLKEAFGNDK